MDNVVTFRRRPRCNVCGKAIEDEALGYRKRCRDLVVRPKRAAEMEAAGVFAGLDALEKKIRDSAAANDAAAVEDRTDLAELLVNLEEAFRQIDSACDFVAEAAGASPDMDERLKRHDDWVEQTMIKAPGEDDSREAFEARAQALGPLWNALDALAGARKHIAHVWVALSPDD
jgi:hypothetical protein